MKQTGKLIVIVTMLAIVFVLALLVWTFIEGRKELALERESERPINIPSRVSVEHGESVITIDVASQKLNGIATTTLSPTSVAGYPGVIVPDASIVWFDGSAWAYFEKEEERFVRRRVSVDHRVGEGFVTDKFSSGDRVVVQGAQLLLSEELKSQIHITE